MTLVGCASNRDSVGPATTVAPTADRVAEVLTPNPETDPGELSTTVVTDASEIDNTTEPIVEPTLAESSGVQPEGFTTVTVRITKTDGEVCEVCMWLADDANERGQGLMGVTDLGDAAGMIFAFDQLRNGNFFMFQTVTPLSIAWFDDAGVFFSATNMDPCLFEDSSLCERFSPGGPYMSAIEVFQGDLASIGIEPGAAAVIVPGTETDGCPTTL